MTENYEWSAEIVGFPHTGANLMAAKRRIERAGVHHGELLDLIEEFEDMNFDTVKVRMSGESAPSDPDEDLELDWGDTTPPPMATIAIIAGELIYNLRAALDYLVYTLAWFDSGTEVEMTQFPIVDTEETFLSRRDSWLKGVSDDHVQMIKGFQPFAGCDWTRLLREFSNPDKHKKLTLVTPKWVAYFDTDSHNWSPVVREQGKVETVVPRLDVDVMLDEEHSALETLGRLIASTTSVIQDFSHLFPKEPRFSVRIDN